MKVKHYDTLQWLDLISSSVLMRIFYRSHEAPSQCRSTPHLHFLCCYSRHYQTFSAVSFLPFPLAFICFYLHLHHLFAFCFLDADAEPISLCWNRLTAVSYSPAIVTMSLFCIISETKRDIGQKSWFFIPFCIPSSLGVLVGVLIRKDQNNGKKVLAILTEYRRVTDGQTDRHLATA